MKTREEILAKVKEVEASDEYVDAAGLLLWALDPSPVVHEGAEKDRCDHKHDGWLNKEKIFADKWKEANNPPSFLNHGIGTLTWLLCSRLVERQHFIGNCGQEIYRHLTQEEATAAASAIQWLGTNCGWCWLETCIRDCGFDLTRRREKA